MIKKYPKLPDSAIQSHDRFWNSMWNECLHVFGTFNVDADDIHAYMAGGEL